MEQIDSFPAKRSNEPDTLRLFIDGALAGSAWWHSNTQSYRVHINNKFFYEPDEDCARKALFAGKSTTEQILEALGK